MRKHKNKIILAGIVIAALVFTFWWGGNAPGLQGFKIDKNHAKQSEQQVEKTDSKDVADSSKSSKGDESKPLADKEKDKDAADAKSGEDGKTNKDGIADKDAATGKSDKDAKAAGAAGSGLESRPGGTEGGFTADEKLAAARKIAGGVSSPGVKKGSVAYSEASGMVINKATGKDKYLTDPVPEGKPIPVEPQNAVITSEKGTCTLSIRCNTILDNMKWLDPNKVELVPKDGVIYPTQKVSFYKGESVFNVLLRECKKNKIHMEFQNTPMYNSAYIEGIHNLYEFDCGELSGWMYKVNGWFPNYGCSRYQLKEGDVIEWVYTCNLGIDVGGYYAVE